ncbi:hypothetical protein [Xenorhabdus sp. BG5]|uniref:hypothetical protein n=1 Tax=Xenorhabdus sp. BG5 TaxID=2782014 RepID=UPI001D14F37F|nr:hypothetical protein [Xenorhabdus sp. BG5]
MHGHPELSGTGSALQGALKMAGAAIVLGLFSSEHTTTAAGLMWGLFILALICFVFITFTLYRVSETKTGASYRATKIDNVIFTVTLTERIGILESRVAGPSYVQPTKI